MVLAGTLTERIDGSEAAVERRRGDRVREERPVKIFEPTIARFFPGRTTDVGTTGLRLEVPMWAPIRPGKVISVHVGLNGAGEALAHRRHMIPARVVWVDRTSEKTRGRLLAGVEFVASVAARLDAA
jgi:hypothetical protein